MLIDEGGRDSFRAGAAAQGYGGAGGAGALIDRAGDDAYFAGGRLPDFREPGHFQSLSQGYGTGIRPFAAGGVGLLLDGAGDDRYAGERDVQGFGVEDRGYGSIGVLLDGGGRDHYAGQERDGEMWTNGEYGVGLDAEAEVLW